MALSKLLMSLLEQLLENKKAWLKYHAFLIQFKSYFANAHAHHNAE